MRQGWKKKKIEQIQVILSSQTTLEGLAVRSRRLHRRADQGYDTKYVTIPERLY